MTTHPLSYDELDIPLDAASVDGDPYDRLPEKLPRRAPGARLSIGLADGVDQWWDTLPACTLEICTGSEHGHDPACPRGAEIRLGPRAAAARDITIGVACTS